MKKLFLKSVFFIAVTSIIFLPVYFFMIYMENKGDLSRSEDIYGSWKAFQYYCENTRYPCNDEKYMEIEFSEESVIISENIIDGVNGKLKWENSRTLCTNSENENTRIIVSLKDENMKVTSEDEKYIVMLKKVR